jgi:hypothetical protein
MGDPVHVSSFRELLPVMEFQSQREVICFVVGDCCCIGSECKRDRRREDRENNVPV